MNPDPKGGTAINLFYLDLSRLSVDIDLTHLPIKDRDESLAEINDTMDRISASIEAGILSDYMRVFPPGAAAHLADNRSHVAGGWNQVSRRMPLGSLKTFLNL